LKKKNKGIHWVQHGMTAASQQWLPPAQVLLQIEPEALKSLYRSPGNKKKQLVLCKNYVLQW
jgi:hypothetical protein